MTTPAQLPDQCELKLYDVDTSVEQRIDALEILLLYSAGETLLPELYAVFGKECILRFLDLFAGTTITVPSREIITQAVRDVDVWVRLREQDDAEVRKYLRDKYSISDTAIQSIYDRMDPIMIAGGVVRRKKRRDGSG